MAAPWSLLVLALLFCAPCAGAEQTCRDSIPVSAPDSRFILNDDGTVTDNTTGLVWMRCSLGQKWDGRSCRGEAGRFSWGSALQAAAGQEFAGRSDWRLPNKNELESIIEESCFAPAVNPRAFPANPGDYFWSSSPYAGLATGAWSVDFGYGTVTPSVKTGALHVRLLRDDAQAP